MAIKTLTCILLAIQMIKFFLWMAFGDSTVHYRNSGMTPFQGICQGNGGGQASFIDISIILMKVLHGNGQIAIFVCATSGLNTRFSSFIFVDIFSMINHSLYPGKTVEAVVERTQAGTNTWQVALQASGGDLKIAKTVWTLINTFWSDGQW
jgi:hypothetical protein